MVLHAFDVKHLSLCGANWEWGRNENDFMLSVENHFPVLVRCKECVEKLKEKGLENGKKSVNRKTVLVS